MSEHYGNIPMTVIKSFISQCERCTEKIKKSNNTGIVVRPITVEELNQRGQVDLVDFQSLPDGEFKFILNYQEHLTKFKFLIPLKSKTAVDVAKALLSIFLQFGAPHVLQSDNGREFTAGIIKELGCLWKDLVLVNGRPRHPQSQGSVERSNASVKDSIVAWMRDNNTSSWSTGLPFVQWALNTTYHEAIKMQPYEAVFGQKARMGLKSKIPQEFLEKITNGIFEENMLEALQEEPPSIEPAPRRSIVEHVGEKLSNDVNDMEFVVTEVVDSGSTISHNFNNDINEMECVVSDVVDGDSIVISDNLNNPIDFSSLDFLQQNDNPDNIITPTCNNASVEEHPA